MEYGVVTILGRRIDATATRLCAPIGTISDKDRQQHGISEDATEGQLPFNAEWSYFANLRDTGPLGAHNAAVEDGFLRSVWAYPRSAPDFSEVERKVPSWGPWLDTLHLYRRLYPGLDSYKLGDLVRLFELETDLAAEARIHCPPPRSKYHSALYDALASALLLLRLYDLPELSAMTLRWLIMESAPSASARESMGQQDLF